ncbi:MAG: B12-binding domain-containing radical SAM protein [Anaeromyxobacter sp.]|nr:B12-binding domain-containing radical SAM protein [Anaeromyxobacter sp.]
MKIALISPEFPFSAKVPMVPPILEYLGALTLREAPGTTLSLHDANQRRVDPTTLDADLVGISVWTATAPWAYRFADACRAAGKKVVLGGIHATARPDEAARHADAVVTGEAESCWGEVLRDAAAGRLRPRYLGEQRPLDGLVRPIDAKLKGNYQFRAFFTMRGCPYACSFCSVHHFFGRTIRYRPVEEVVAEVEALAGRVWFNGDDNIWGADVDRAVQLFDTLAARTPRPWYGFGDLRSVQGPQGERLLRAARRSGLFSVWAGWESDTPAALEAFGASGKQGRDREEAVRRMQGHGLEVVLFVVLGGREDDFDAYRRTLDLADRLRVGVHPVLLTPLPGTALWDAYQPHLLPGLGWDAFTGVRATFHHPDPRMTTTERERQFHEVCREIYRPRRMLRRLGAIHRSGFPVSHGLSLMSQLPMRHALGKARKEWLAAQPPAGQPLPGPAPALAAAAVVGARRRPEPRRFARTARRLHLAATGAWTSSLAGASAALVAAEEPALLGSALLLEHAGEFLAGTGWVAASLAATTGAWRARRLLARPRLAPRALPLGRAAAIGFTFAAALAWQVAVTW